MKDPVPSIVVRPTRASDFPGVIALTRKVYPQSPPWNEAQLASHLQVFPEGQLVAVDPADNVMGMAASLILRWSDYDGLGDWKDFTDRGYFSNHDPAGRTLYGAEVMVAPLRQGGGIGKKLYAARRDLARRLGLLRIRAGARLRGYHRYAATLDPRAYVIKVVRREIQDPTLSFQLRQGFEVLGVVSGYLQHDPESLGHAAVIEWVNEEVARPEDLAGRDPAFLKPPHTAGRAARQKTQGDAPGSR